MALIYLSSNIKYRWLVSRSRSENVENLATKEPFVGLVRRKTRGAARQARYDADWGASS